MGEKRYMDKTQTESKLAFLQQLELEALAELKAYCDKHDIMFFLRGGSVMGAVKYNGFIPWDDDMDIAVPREGYDRLISLSEKEPFSDKFTLESYHFNPEAHCYFPRILLKEELRMQYELPRNNTMGLVLIDVLPLDGAPSGGIALNWYFFKVYLYRVLAALWTMDQKETVNMHSRRQNALLRVLRGLQIHRLYTQEGIYKRLDSLYRKNCWKTSKMAGTITGSLREKEIMPASIWGEGILHTFGSHEFYIPSEYDEYLKRLYGADYMETLPSEEKRKSHMTQKL